MLTWLKNIFSSPKTFIRSVINAMDLAVPFLAAEFDKLKGRYSDMTSIEQAQVSIDRLQAYLIKTFHLDA